MIGTSVSYCEIQGLFLSLYGPGGEGLAGEGAWFL